MAVLLKGLRLVTSAGIQKPIDYVFENEILSISENSEKRKFDQIIDGANWYLSESWLDLRCVIGEPGLEYKETVQSLCELLTSSGFGSAVVLPNTEPTIQSKNEVDFLLNKSRGYSSELIIQGAVTKNTEGEDLTEILDMHHQSGVFIFGDGIMTLSNGDRYMKILQYLQKFNGLLFDHAL
jgi:dihydroorotase